jgi:hypothetical protein
VEYDKLIFERAAQESRKKNPNEPAYYIMLSMQRAQNNMQAALDRVAEWSEAKTIPISNRFRSKFRSSKSIW